MLDVIISCNNERVFIRNFSDHTSQIIFDTCWGSKNVDTKHLFAWNDSRHAPSGRFYLHWGIEETGIPWIIWIICHQVLRHTSEHGTISIVKHILTKAHIAKLNKLTESELIKLTSLTVDKTALVILKREESQGIRTVCSQREFIFEIHVDPYWPKWLTKHSKLAAKCFETCKFHPGMWNCYLM